MDNEREQSMRCSSHRNKYGPVVKGVVRKPEVVLVREGKFAIGGANEERLG